MSFIAIEAKVNRVDFRSHDARLLNLQHGYVGAPIALISEEAWTTGRRPMTQERPDLGRSRKSQLLISIWRLRRQMLQLEEEISQAVENERA